MRTLVVSLSFLVFWGSAAFAAEDPIAVRQSLMQANAAASGAASAMLNGDMEYNPVVAKASIATFNAVAHAIGNFFPEGSDTGDTAAAPVIWEDPQAFRAQLGEFQTAVANAVEASGSDGPADLDSFRDAVMPVMAICSDCHGTFRQ